MTVRNDHYAQKLDTGLVSVDVEVTGGYGGSGDRRQEKNAAVVQCQPTPKFRHLLLLAILALPGCSGQAQAPVTVFCAASLAPVVQALAQAYQKNGGSAVQVSSAATSTLARQILQGAPVDLFLAAHPQWTERLYESGSWFPPHRLHRFETSLSG